MKPIGQLGAGVGEREREGIRGCCQFPVLGLGDLLAPRTLMLKTVGPTTQSGCPCPLYIVQAKRKDSFFR